MVDVPLMVHKPAQHDAPTPPRHCRKVCEGKQEMLLLLANKNIWKIHTLISSWTLIDSAPELLRRAKTVYHSSKRAEYGAHHGPWAGFPSSLVVLLWAQSVTAAAL